MPQIVIDTATENQLRGISQPVELLDHSGNVLGVFNPTTAKGPLPQISPQEIHRRIASGGGRSLDKIIADLEKRS